MSLDGEIHASYSNFGFVPYGQTIMGKIHFDKNNEDGCEPYPMKDVQELERSADVTPFYIARRGDCSFVQKIRNMENMGVAVGIVIDDKKRDIKSTLMSDDGTGGGIRIPSMLISKNDGDIILEWYRKAKSSDKANLVVMAEFKMPATDNNVNMDLWMTSSSNRALDFIEDF